MSTHNICFCAKIRNIFVWIFLLSGAKNGVFLAESFILLDISTLTKPD